MDVEDDVLLDECGSPVRCKLCNHVITVKTFAFGHIKWGYACSVCKDLGVFDKEEVYREISRREIEED